MPLTTYLNHERVRAFSQRAYAKNNFAIVANGVSHEDLSKWVQEFFWDWKTSTSEVDLPPVENKPSKYYGGEERIAHGSGDSMIIAFPGSGSFTGSAYKPEISVLAALLGGQSSIKWSPGFSLLARATAAFPQAHIKTFHSTYSDAGLLQISISGNADHIRPASHEVVKTLNSVAAGNFSQEDFKKAVAAAKFNTLDAGQDIREGLELAGGGLVNGGNVYQIDEVAKSIERVTEEQLKKVCTHL
jgi:ubiquinol-cytochrome c reductase core subunit 2